MRLLVIYKYQAGMMAHRALNETAHFAYLDAHRDEVLIVAVYAMNRMLLLWGSLWVLEVASLSEQKPELSMIPTMHQILDAMKY